MSSSGLKGCIDPVCEDHDVVLVSGAQEIFVGAGIHAAGRTGWLVVMTVDGRKRNLSRTALGTVRLHLFVSVKKVNVTGRGNDYTIILKKEMVRYSDC